MSECTIFIGTKKWLTPEPTFDVSIFGPNVTLFDTQDKAFLAVEGGKVVVKDKGRYNVREVRLEDFLRPPAQQSPATSAKRQKQVLRQQAIALWYNANKERLAATRPADSKQLIGWKFQQFSALPVPQQERWVEEARKRTGPKEEDAAHPLVSEAEDSTSPVPSPALAPTQAPPAASTGHKGKERKKEKKDHSKDDSKAKKAKLAEAATPAVKPKVHATLFASSSSSSSAKPTPKKTIYPQEDEDDDDKDE